MKKTILTVFFLLMSAGAFAQDAGMKIYQAVRQGVLSRKDAVVAEAYMLFDRDEFSRKYPGLVAPEVIKSGTPIIANLKNSWGSLSPEERTFFSKYLMRPGLPSSIVSTNGHFRIHYSTLNFDPAAVSIKDDDANGIPDYVDEVNIALEHAWYVMIDSLGLPAPPDDYGVDGQEYDVYIVNASAGGIYGATYWDQPVSSTPRNDYTSYLEIDNDFTSSIYYTKGLGGMRITVAHEFFHGIQLGIVNNISQDRWFYEISSTWMEDFIYDDMNDYLQYVNKATDGFIAQINNSLTLVNGWHEYGAAIFAHFLEKRYGVQSIVNSWLYMTTQTAIPALDYELQQLGSNFDSAVAEFYTWCWFTGERADSEKYFEEGELYNLVTADYTHNETSSTGSFDLENFYLGPTYTVIEGYSPSKYTVSTSASAEDAGLWTTYAVVLEGNTSAGLAQLVNISSTSARGTFTSDKPVSKLLVVSTNTATGGNPNRTDRKYVQSLNFSISGQEITEKDRFFVNIPNPFIIGEHNFTQLPFLINESGDVKVRIVNSYGTAIKTYDLKSLSRGYYENLVTWDGTDSDGRLVASGIYIALLKTSAGEDRMKLAVIRK